MKCPTETELLLHLDDPQGRATPSDLGRHLETCASCSRRAQELRCLDALIAREEPLPARLLERALAIAEHPTRGSWWPAAAMGGLVAACFLVLVWVSRDTSVPPPSPRPTAARNPAAVTSTDDPLARVDLAPELDDATLDDAPLGALHRFARGRDVPAALAAIDRLGTLARSESLPVLRDVLRRPERREAAAKALGLLGDSRAVPDLEALLPDPHAEAAVIRIGGEAAARALSRRLALAECEEERARLLEALGHLGGPTGVYALLARLDDPLAGPAAWTSLSTHEVRLLPHLLAVATSPQARRAERALAVLERLAPAEAVGTLEALLARRSRRAAAARALARIDTPEAQTALLEALPASGIREAFRTAGPGMAARLLAGLSTGTRHDRRGRIDLLGLCGRADAVAPLAAWADDPALAPGVVTALGRIGGDEAVEVLGRLASRPALRGPAIEALGWTGSAVAVPVLVDLARQGRGLLDPVLRALARHASEEAVRAIALLDGRGMRTVRTLRGMDRQAVVPVLLAMAQGDDAFAAGRARRALRAFPIPVPGAALAARDLH